jgi:hypothetical protein
MEMPNQLSKDTQDIIENFKIRKNAKGDVLNNLDEFYNAYNAVCSKVRIVEGRNDQEEMLNDLFRKGLMTFREG